MALSNWRTVPNGRLLINNFYGLLNTVRNMNKTAPILPTPRLINLEVKKTALLVLDQSQLAADQSYHGHRLIPSLTRLLSKARDADLYIIFTLLLLSKGTPQGQVYSGYNRRETEPLIFTNGYDKFMSGELLPLLKKRAIETLILVGSRANLCVLYTGTRAASDLHYKVVIPLDGMAAYNKYEEEYTLHQFSTFPGGVSDLFTFTTINGINFK